MSTNPFRPGGKDDAHQGSGPRNAVANAGSSETTRQTFTDHDLPKVEVENHLVYPEHRGALERVERGQKGGHQPLHAQVEYDVVCQMRK